MATLPSLDAFRGEDDYEDDSDHSTTMQGPMSGPSRVPTTTEYSLGEDDEVDKLLKQVNNTISTDYSEVEPETLSIPVKIADETSPGDREPNAEGPGRVTTLGDVVPLPATADAPESRVIGVLHVAAEEDSPEEDTKRSSQLAKITAQDGEMLAQQIQQTLSQIPGLELSSSNSTYPLVEYLVKSVAKLSLENTMLKEALAKAGRDSVASTNGADTHAVATEAKEEDDPAPDDDEKGPTFKLCHMVRCSRADSYFEDHPRMFQGDHKSDHLRGLRGHESIVTYLEKRKELAFAVIPTYICSCAGGQDYHVLAGYKNGKMLADSPLAAIATKRIVMTEALKKALVSIQKAHPDRFKGWDLARLPTDSYQPYFLFYVHHKTLIDLSSKSGLTEFEQKSVELICNWAAKDHEKDWAEADELLARGKITTKHYEKLFRPGELVLIPRIEAQGGTWAHQVGSFPWQKESGEIMDLEAWDFNGAFRKWETKVNLLDAMKLQSGGHHEKRDGEIDITALAMYPLRYAEPGTYNKLVARGNKFWNCRKTKIVAYCDPDSAVGEDDPVEQRFMVDYKMFLRMHPGKPLFKSMTDDLGPAATNAADPPSDDFLALLPPMIHAFDFSSKSWKHIKVDYITDVTWNKEAFKQLVVPEETKELIQASVMAHGQNMSASPDIIAGKGQGLLILLHGGPGTGKTLTAESIAETQERPLYRVTCGDIGIEPSEVEEYLKSVLAIGKAWGCVILLDEADVFLEERTMTDQKQNAIVSVFLRMLEYYDGILILTTNRVGTFDEAFKSRIHLALRYKNLDEEQRVEIWRNFIRRLAKTRERIDISDLELNVNKLARVELNGRQIRNVITLARYLAKFRKQILVYKHVQDAFASVVKFDEYLLQLRGSDDRWATEQRLR